MTRKFFSIFTFLMITFSVFTGCGGSGSGSDSDPGTGSTAVTIKGTAAAGLPIVGIVNVKGANGNTASAQIDTAGHFELDVSALTAPYLLFARGSVNGETLNLFSTGVAAGNINITPITNLITSRVMDGVSETDFDNWASESSSVTGELIEDAETLVQNQLAPILEAYGVPDTSDLMSMEFDTDHSGIDAVLDTLRIEIDGSNVPTITNVATGEAITGDEVFDSSEGDAVAQIIIETAQINIIGDVIEDLWSVATPTPTELNDNLAPLVADEFLTNGLIKSLQLDRFAAGDGPNVGIQDISITIDDIMTPAPAGYSKGYWASIHFNDNGKIKSKFSSFVYDDMNSKWLWYGNQRWADIDFSNRAQLYVNPDGSTTYSSSIHLCIEDEFNYAYTTKGVVSAIVTGPGLPGSGVVMDRNFPLDHFTISGFFEHDYYLTNDVEIAAIPENSEYILRFYDVSSDTVDLGDLPLVTYTEKVSGKPFLNSELVPGLFPVLTSPTSHSIYDLDIGGDINISWNKPEEYSSDMVEVFWTDGPNTLWQEKDLLSDATSVTIDTSTNNIASPNYANITIWGNDVDNREIVYSWAFSNTAPGAGKIIVSADGITGYNTGGPYYLIVRAIPVGFTESVADFGVEIDDDLFSISDIPLKGVGDPNNPLAYTTDIEVPPGDYMLYIAVHVQGNNASPESVVFVPAAVNGDTFVQAPAFNTWNALSSNALQGTWLFDYCDYDSEDNESQSDQYIFSSGSAGTRTNYTYPGDNGCSTGLLYEFTKNFTYELIDFTITSDGDVAEEINYTLQSVMVTPRDQGFVDDMNDISRCGIGDWAVDVTREITGLDCGGEDIIDSAGTIKYDIFKVNGSKFYNGDSEDDIYEGDSEATRPRRLELGGYTKQ